MPFGGHKGLADLAALFSADRDVLQVGVVGRQPPGVGHSHVVGGVDTSGFRVDLAGEFVGIGVF